MGEFGMGFRVCGVCVGRSDDDAMSGQGTAGPWWAVPTPSPFKEVFATVGQRSIGTSSSFSL